MRPEPSGPLDPSFFDANLSFANADPEVLLIDREKAASLLENARKLLSEFEVKILGYYLDGLTCREIAETVGKSPNRWTTLCSAYAAKLRGNFYPATSATAERNIFFSKRG